MNYTKLDFKKPPSIQRTSVVKIHPIRCLGIVRGCLRSQCWSNNSSSNNSINSSNSNYHHNMTVAVVSIIVVVVMGRGETQKKKKRRGESKLQY